MTIVNIFNVSRQVFKATKGVFQKGSKASKCKALIRSLQIICPISKKLNILLYLATLDNNILNSIYTVISFANFLPDATITFSTIKKIMTNEAIVKEAYSFFATGNIPAVLALFHPAIEWHECKGMPFVKDDGIYTGAEAIVTNVFMNLPVYFDGFNIAVTEIFSAGEKVVMTGYYQGTNKATGNAFKANATHTWTVNEGKLAHFFQAVDTAVINS